MLDRVFCVVIVGDTSRAVELPLEASVRFGRGKDADVAIEDVNVSRLHARLDIEVEGMFLEDLGSRNGTAVNGTRIGDRVRVSPGDVLQMGSATLLLTRVATTEAHGGTVHGHDEWRLRLLDDLERARRHGRPLSVITVQVQTKPQAIRGLQLVIANVRNIDVVGYFTSVDFEVCLPDTGRTGAEQCARRIRERYQSEGIEARIGVASFPEDGVEAARLLGKAREALRGTEEGSLPPIVLDETMVRLAELACRVATSNLPVLLLGETGVGKEVFAQLVHAHSPRAGHRLVSVNCATLSGTLLESELFGYEKGAFTGAASRKVGLIEHASGGTLFLDEVGELPQETQAKLLRVLEDKRVVRLGGVTPTEVDVRVVAATNRNLLDLVARGAFRSDLLYRFNAVTLIIPPLRDRPAEIIPLCERFLQIHAAEEGRVPPTIDEEARAFLISHAWPGNIRQLRNVVERALLLAGYESKIRLEHCLEPLLPSGLQAERPPDRPRSFSPPQHGDFAEGHDTGTFPLMSEPEDEPPARAGRASAGPLSEDDDKKRLVEALEQTGGNQTRAAALLGIPRRTFVWKLRRYGLRGSRSP